MAVANPVVHCLKCDAPSARRTSKPLPRTRRWGRAQWADYHCESCDARYHASIDRHKEVKR